MAVTLWNRRQAVFGIGVGVLGSLLLKGCGRKEKDWGGIIKCVEAKDAIKSNKILAGIMEEEGKRGPILHFDIAPFNAKTEEAVRAVQMGLRALDYKVKADGYYGDETARALKDLQIRNGIPIDWAHGNNGKKLGPETLKALCRELGNTTP